MPRRVPDPDLSQLRHVLTPARKAKLLTQEELADLAGISRQSILDIGSGKSRGSIETWARIAYALEVPLDELLAPIWASTESAEL